MPLLIFYLATVALTTWAQSKVTRATAQYSAIPSRASLAGHEAARRMLDSVGLFQIPVAPSPGMLPDHYDPRNRELRLSGNVYGESSIYSLAVAAHETGHAVQHAIRHPFLIFRTAMIPVSRYGPGIGYVLMLVGGGMLIAGIGSLGLRITLAGALVYALTIALTFASLPIEFNASGRAITLLDANKLVSSEERDGIKKVLNAAALTYVAAAATSLFNVLRLFRPIR